MTSATSLPATFSPQWLDARLASLLPGYPDVPLCVALSGGVDSVTLLVALAEFAHRKSLRAIHVHHGLHANADRWTDHCVSLARRLRVPLDVVRLKLTPGRGESVEATARDARYAALMQALHPGEVLLTAHHQDDQLETVLLQLLRGAGVAGLAAMPEVTPFAAGRLARPLLSRSRAELESWARARKLAWVEDDSNLNERFDRNYLRGTVLPLIRTRWPGAATAVSRTARHAGEAQRLLDTLARADVESAAIGNQLSVQRLRALDIERRRNALRYWISAQGHRVPDSSRLDEIAGPLLSARADARPAVCWGDSVVKREADALWLGSERVKQTPSEEVAWHWEEARRLELRRLRRRAPTCIRPVRAARSRDTALDADHSRPARRRAIASGTNCANAHTQISATGSARSAR